ncbi:IclR family transcriptional regulator [Mesorhizobium sp. B4-1-4]|uniref:IclR family transcriptional regulator domain-containing protein n=1 Tax=Mesorhizobium sp. B4-1-4 TaxID=2589888 RepID=UPI001D009282|nr:IclR family transcriptional regulator [Mesorhizobium sp. B4-1-4]UCI34959.1 IclR family transcriptional regulator [Mesorhizobium sp. B4-1-4]
MAAIERVPHSYHFSEGRLSLRTAVRQGFYPTPKWHQLATSILEAEPLPGWMSRAVKLLAANTGETVWISAASGQYAIVLDVMESEAPVRYAAPAGKRVLTASGQALLSQFSLKDRDILLRKATFDERGPRAARTVEEVVQQIDAGLERGWFWSASCHTPDLGGVAIPMIANERVDALTVAGPLYRVEVLFESFAAAIYDVLVREHDCEQNKVSWPRAFPLLEAFQRPAT